MTNKNKGIDNRKFIKGLTNTLQLQNHGALESCRLNLTSEFFWVLLLLNTCYASTSHYEREVKHWFGILDVRQYINTVGWNKLESYLKSFYIYVRVQMVQRNRKIASKRPQEPRDRKGETQKYNADEYIRPGGGLLAYWLVQWPIPLNSSVS